MIKIKILISLALCVLMLCTITVPAFAEEEPGVSREDIMFAEYAEVGKGTYFDTGYTKDKCTTVLMDVNVKSSYENYFGVKKEYHYTFWDEDEGMHGVDFDYCQLRLIRDPFDIGAGYQKEFKTINAESLPNGRHTVELGPDGFYIDGTEKLKFSGNKVDVFIPPVSLYLFGTHVSNLKTRTSDYRFYADLHQIYDNMNEYVTDAVGVTFYSCQIYEENELVHDYVPAVIKSSNKSVIYDIVTDTVHQYSGVADNVVSCNLSNTLYEKPATNKLHITTGYTISEGSIVIIIGFATLALGFVGGYFVGKKKKKKLTLANGEATERK